MPMRYRALNLEEFLDLALAYPTVIVTIIYMIVWVTMLVVYRPHPTLVVWDVALVDDRIHKLHP